MPETVGKPKRGRPRKQIPQVPQFINLPKNTPKGIAIEDIINLRAKGLSYAEIGLQLGCDSSNVCKRLEPYDEELKGLSFYRDNRGAFFDVIEQKIAFSLTDEEIKKASFRDKFVAIGILRDKANDNKGITNNYFQTVVVQAHDKPAQKSGNIIDGQVTPVDNVDNSLNTNETGI